jgi:hypothetical protein
MKKYIIECFQNGNTVNEACTLNPLASKKYVIEVYGQEVNKIMLTCSRLNQIKSIEFQLFEAIENSFNPVLIERLTNSYVKFLL